MMECWDVFCRIPRCIFIILATFAATASPANAADSQDITNLAQQLRQLDGRVIELGKVRQPPLAGMWSRDVASRLRQANVADQEAWGKVKTRAERERF